MICEKCKKNEATYYYKENVNGAERSYHLCAACAKELETSGELKSFGKAGNSLFGGWPAEDPMSLFSSLFSTSMKQGSGKRTDALTERTKCSLCGAVFEDLVREGKVGCPKCYDVFADELAESIRRIHGRSAHTGKEPSAFRAQNEAKRKRNRLEGELKEAIQSENYERAAELRDELKALRESEANDEERGQIQ